MKSAGKPPDDYQWLVVVEGESDCDTLKRYFPAPQYCFVAARGKPNALNGKWEGAASVLSLAATRESFLGMIILVDKDDDTVPPFNAYRRISSPLLRYCSPELPTPTPDQSNSHWNLDIIKGRHRLLAVLGITVPAAQDGCMETDMLEAYGFPVPSQGQYHDFKSIVVEATRRWDIRGGKDWWTPNERSKLDKFMYVALTQGFARCCYGSREEDLPGPKHEPQIIVSLRTAVEAWLSEPQSN
ncbi:MAG: hypothetical protein FWD57_00100 [Polyangiaceae bacterium]|nr:hypothetical protein [Polyangiaceae bacterium]